MHDVRDIVVLARDAAMSTTYKPALLKAIVRLQVERERKVVVLNDIAEQFAQLYWTQTVIFHLRQAASLSKEPEVLRALRTRATQANAHRYGDLAVEDRALLVKSIARTLRIDVLRRFHAGLPSGSLPLFSWHGGDEIVLTDAAVTFIRRDAMALEVIANHWWARFLEKVNILAPSIIRKIELDNVRRRSLAWFCKLISGVDEDRCFCCGVVFSASTVARHVDHVIPWSFLLDDPPWDLVFACARCNTSKSDRLPRQRFIEQLDMLNNQRLKCLPNFMRRAALMPSGGISQLYEAALNVEWPSGWEPALD